MKDGLLERIIIERSFMEVYCCFHPLSALRRELSRIGAVSADSLRSLPHNSRVIVSGLVIFFHTPPTRSGKRIIFATLEDETGLLDAVILPHIQKRWGKTIYTSEILTMEGRLLKQGKKGLSVSIKAVKIMHKLSGRIEDVACTLKRFSFKTKNP